MIDFSSNQILLDDSLNGRSMSFENPCDEIVAFNKSEFFDALEKINEFKKTKYLVGYIRYEAYKFFQGEDDTFDKPALYFGVYNESENIELPSIQYDAHIEFEKCISKGNFDKNIVKIKDEIAQGNTYQVNYTFDNKLRSFSSVQDLYLSLRKKQRTSYGAFIKNDFDTIISFSPELFFEIEGNKIVTKPMKGTVNRGSNDIEDAKLKEFLVNDEKNKAENLMIVDLLRNDISRIADNVTVKSLFDIETYETLHQMTSTIEGNLKTDNVKDWLEALFPCGSITGAPKINTMKIIDEIEQGKRDVYCGAIGYFSPEKTVLSVPIRILQLIESDWKYRVGGGIVWDSKADEEWDEAGTKSSFLLPKNEFQIIETMLVENGEIIYENEHLKRMENSAKFFGFKFDGVPKIDLKDGILRLLLSKNGEINYEFKKIGSISNKIKLSLNKTDSENLFLQHKTTYRAWYNVNFDDVFDVIFFNEKDEITEGARTNIFIKKDGKLFTPPQNCGLLNGVLRQKMIDNGECEEKILLKNDLLGADEVYCGNSVRGLVKVELI